MRNFSSSNSSSVQSPDVKVVIPVRGRRRELDEVLEALARQDFPREKFEVLVCDDGSTEDLRSVAELPRGHALADRELGDLPSSAAAWTGLGAQPWD
jgi:hypothetical protein